MTDFAARKVVVLGRSNCVWCERVKDLLRTYGVTFADFNIIDCPELIAFLQASGLTTVPQVFVDGQLVGGYQETRAVILPDAR
jgi:glutaredoxin